MEIREMGRDDCLQALSDARVARLACAMENQPYVIPVFLAFYQSECAGPCLYGFATQGQKVEWMRANPSVCVEVDEIEDIDTWMSVIAFGKYEELPNDLDQNVHRVVGALASKTRAEAPSAITSTNERVFAYQLLQSRAMWWEPATSTRNLGGANPTNEVTPIFYKIRINDVTGYRTVRP
jgi:nitroimidazol reductase NimA-like FMN-containing flavoprotein (pyridoxamine 5'-phosphate oxidase superfamily)